MAEARQIRLLDVQNLFVSFTTPNGIVEAVRGISFGVDRGKTLGIVGESGSGKSVATQAMVNLIRGARVSGCALFEGNDLLKMTPGQLREVRGQGIAMIFQNPMSSFHPLYRIGWQIEEMIRAHDSRGQQKPRTRAIELLGRVGIPWPERRVDDYPHQFSGGMLQRAMIAMALALNPRLIIADEPTSSLDVTVQAQILSLMRSMQREFNMAIIFITHDLGIIAEIADEVMVMYAGSGMEYGSKQDLFQHPSNPYTKGLLCSVPRAGEGRLQLTPIPGQPPSLLAPSSGCLFKPRCSSAIERCGREMPPLAGAPGGDGHRSACWLAAEGSLP